MSTRWFFLRGFVLSLVSGLLYGFSFVAVQFMKLCEDEEHSCSGKSVVCVCATASNVEIYKILRLKNHFHN